MLIRELEEQLGFRLFERTMRHVALAEYGARFLPAAEHSLQELQSAVASIGRLAAERAQSAAPYISAIPSAAAASGGSDARRAGRDARRA